MESAKAVGAVHINQTNRLNGQIRAQSLRVVDEDGQQLGVMSRHEALDLAEQRELDLVEISPNANPPVAKIVDWGKYNYQRTKQLQKNRKNARAQEVKQIRFGLKISEHDLAVKMRKVTGFLESGHKVKITAYFRGREMAHKDVGFKLAERVIASFGDSITVDQQPQLAGKQLSFVVRSSGKPAQKQGEHDA
ncbi:translation initiation factor IF-3 [Candidatus Saccharibacteria bacterium]|nr:MAG: translation initiation factor IF-3 [Candidatus Saccharibacteria bacterium]